MSENTNCKKCECKYLNKALDEIIQEKSNLSLQNENQYSHTKLRDLDKEIKEVKSYLNL